jgi:restriction endonuclease S subunit
MNHSKSQQYLKGQAIGSSLLSISKAVLQQLEIFIPPLTQQEIILKISELRSREIALQSQIEALREKKIQQLLLNILKD